MGQFHLDIETGGVKGFLNNVKKTADSVPGGTPYQAVVTSKMVDIVSNFNLATQWCCVLLYTYICILELN